MGHGQRSPLEASLFVGSTVHGWMFWCGRWPTSWLGPPPWDLDLNSCKGGPPLAGSTSRCLWSSHPLVVWPSSGDVAEKCDLKSTVLLGAVDCTVVLVSSQSASGSWGRYCGFTPSLSSTSETKTQILPPSLSHIHTIRRLLTYISVYFLIFVFHVLYVCFFLEVQQLAIHCVFLFALYPFITFTPIFPD